MPRKKTAPRTASRPSLEQLVQILAAMIRKYGNGGLTVTLNEELFGGDYTLSMKAPTEDLIVVELIDEDGACPSCPKS